MLVKGRSSSQMLNNVVKKVGALTIAASMMPSYGYVKSDWNPSDGASRYWEKRKRKRSSFPRRRRKPIEKSPDPKSQTRRNRSYEKDFDSTKGYPGEGPARKKRDNAPDQRRRKVKVPAGAERFMARRTQLERVIVRRGFKLRQVAMKPYTKKLYQAAFAALWKWAGCPPPIHVESRRAYDALLSEYIAQAWECGLTRGEAGNALSASVAAYPELRGKGRLPESWFLLSCWTRLEIPCRAPPLPAVAVLAISHWLCVQGEDAAAFLVAAGYDGFLRTRELLSLTWADVRVDASGGVISLAHTKVGQRSAAFEASVMLDPLVPRLFQRARAARARGTSENFYVFPGSEARFYELFSSALQALELAEFGFRPYSLRRGGATAYYRATRNMAATIERGRWSSLRVARIYINDGVAKEVELRLTPVTESRLMNRARALKMALE